MARLFIKPVTHMDIGKGFLKFSKFQDFRMFQFFEQQPNTVLKTE